MVYNDEVNIDHFEILYKNGEDGRVSEVGRTSTWSAYVGNIQFEDENDNPYIGVRSVSVDLKSYSPVVWTHVPRATGSLPEPDTDLYGKTYLNLESARMLRQLKNIVMFHRLLLRVQLKI